MRHELHEPTINCLVGTFLREVKAGNAEFDIPMTHLDDWDVDSLHASDLGTCRRKVSHRMHGDEKKFKSEVELDNEARQFYIANVMHHAFYNAAKWDDRLIDFEVDVTPWMQDGFAGEADAIWIGFDIGEDGKVVWDGDGDVEVVDVKSLHPNWRTYYKTYPKFHNGCQLMSYVKALKKRNTATDKRIVRGRMWYTGRGDKTTSLECPLEIEDWDQTVEVEYAHYLQALTMDPQDIETLPKIIKKTGGDKRLTKVELVPQWHCDWCDYCGLQCVPHDMASNALLYKVPDPVDGRKKIWKVSRLGRSMADRVLAETGISFDNLGAIDDLPVEGEGWVDG